MEGRPASSPLSSQAAARPTAPVGEFVVLDGEDYYRIASFHRLAPFLMSLASDTDLWMFIASGGGLTAGRVDADGSLFPYQTVDQLHDAHHHTGPVTLIRVEQGPGTHILWVPFDPAHAQDPAIERNLYKNIIGNRLVFEEINHASAIALFSRKSTMTCILPSATVGPDVMNSAGCGHRPWKTGAHLPSGPPFWTA